MSDQTGLHLRWIYFEEGREDLRQLRKAVFIEEQELGEFVLESPLDDIGLHLGLYDGDTLVSSISLFLYENDDPFTQKLGLSSESRYMVQYSRRAELKAYRSQKLATLMVAHAIKSVYELFQPEIMFATLMGTHRQYRDLYVANYGFNRHFDIQLEHGEATVIVIDDHNVTHHLVLNMRNKCLELSRLHDLNLPDLAHHISSYEKLYKSYNMEPDQTNRYLNPLSLEDELPRLSAQARMLFMTQESYWKSILNDNPNLTRIIDLGCGPGVYFSCLSKIPEAKTRTLSGMDISDAFISYASFTHPKINWINGSVYKTDLPSGSIDIAHASFLFIHLLKPYLAIKEIYRILSDEGLFYISDVNDTTFKGPAVIADMVKNHSNIYDGNREIMEDIDYLADKAGFYVEDSFSITVENTGTDDHPKLEGQTLKLGKWTMWAMFSFMGQRDEIKDDFSEAESHYMSHSDTISIDIQSKIFKKN